MKKLLLMLLVTTIIGVTSSSSYAQFEKGDNLLNVGLGLGGTYGGGGVGIGASYEKGITDFISVGAQIDFITWSYGYSSYKYKYTFIPIGVRGSYHFGKHFLKMDNLDLYGGPSLGYRISKYKDPSGFSGFYDNAYGNSVFFGVFAGARYYFKPTMSAFAEVGYNESPLKVGISFKF